MRDGRRKIGSGEVGRFDQKNIIFNRTSWDPVVKKDGQRYYGPHVFGDKPGYTLKDWSLSQAAWNIERRFGHASLVGDFGLTQWEMSREEIERTNRMAPDQVYEVSDPENMSRDVKNVATFLGASLVGICKLDLRWVYSHKYERISQDHRPIDIPEEFKYAIVMAYEMDYALVKASPAYTWLPTAGKGYSELVSIVGMLAHFIRGLGYKAIPSVNDTSLCVPMAIDAGLGELGRHGFLITREFGPRVLLSKVLTNLPLVPDRPVEFGVTEFCEICGSCAENCPGRAISLDEPSDEGPNVSNAHGTYKWYINAEKCFKFWSRNGAACTNCIRGCPFNKPKGGFHTAVKSLVKNAPWLNRQMLWGHKVLGYGRRTKKGIFWE